MVILIVRSVADEGKLETCTYEAQHHNSKENTLLGGPCTRADRIPHAALLGNLLAKINVHEQTRNDSQHVSELTRRKTPDQPKTGMLPGIQVRIILQKNYLLTADVEHPQNLPSQRKETV